MHKDPDKAKFSSKIRQRRSELHMSQELLAELSTCHPNHIGRIERNQTDPTFTVIVSIARALKISPKDLMPEE